MLPTAAPGGGATSTWERYERVEAALRQRTAASLGVTFGIAALLVAVGTVALARAELRWVLTALIGACSAALFAAALLARRGQVTTAGLILSGLPTLAGVLGNTAAEQVGAGHFLPVFTVLMAVVTLRGVARWTMMGLAVASVVAMAGVALARGFEVVPASQLLFNGVAVVLLVALTAGLYLRNADRLLGTLAAQEQATSVAERRAEASEARYRLIAENSQDLVALFDEAGRFAYASPSFARVLGRLPPEGATIAWLADAGESGVLEEHLQRARAEGAARCEVGRRRDASPPGRLELLLSRVAEQPLVLCVARDVTAARELATQLQQAQKMEALGRFAGSIAHDFNNLLSIMQTCTTLAQDTLDPAHPARTELHEAQEAITRASGLTRRLLAFSRRDVVVPERVEVEPLLKGVTELVRRLVGPQVSVQLELGEGLGTLWSGPSQLEQVIVNLAANARDAMPGGGVLRLAARVATSPRLGPALLLEVSDTGSGMTPETRAQIFEPFFTTKQRGTGLGMATVFGVVQSLGGYLEVDTAPGQGSRIQVWLPRDRGAGERPPAVEEALRVVRRPDEATVMVVDDDGDVRALMVRLISAEGYQVVSAGSAADAQSLALSLSSIDVLVTDSRLPQSSGAELAEQLLTRFPRMRVVIVSGFAPEPAALTRLVARGARFLAKPFAPGALTRAVREVVGLPPGTPTGRDRSGERPLPVR